MPLDIKFYFNYYFIMIVGFNTDVKYRGEVFHVQTEEKGADNPIIETLVYHRGEILLSRKISYSKFLNNSDLVRRIRRMMKIQHDDLISELRKGKFTHLLSLDTQEIEEQTLDEMVSEYLNENELVF